MKKEGLISIIIPTFNRAHFIVETLESIKKQDYINWECIVVDDGSTDGTEGILENFLKTDSRFIYVKRPNYIPKGANACRNYGFSISKGEFINWFDSDDVMLPNKLKTQINILSRSVGSPFCVSQTQWVNKITGENFGLRSRNIDATNRLENYILYKSYWTILAPFWRKDFITNNNLKFDETLYQSQEYDFHIKALCISQNYAITNEVLSIMYQHNTNLSVDIYTNNLKIESNLKVKERVTENNLPNFSASGKLKWLEILTLYFKKLLMHRKNQYAKQTITLMFKTIKDVEVTPQRKLIFKLKVIIMYISFVLFGKGYTLVKPITN